MIEVICPVCGFSSNTVLSTWDSSPAYPCVCPRCYEFFWIRRGADASETFYLKKESKLNVEIPPLAKSTQIFITNKEHKLFLERGIIVNKNHAHYRVMFKSKDKKLNDKCLWIPEHWVDVVPEELL